MSRQPGSFVRGFKGRAGYPLFTGRQQVAAIYCRNGQRSRSTAAWRAAAPDFQAPAG